MLGLITLFLKNNFFFYKKLKFNEVSLILILFFLLALIPSTDADSLDYHLGFPLDILRNQQFIIREDWYHSKLAGIGENLILLGLFVGSKNFGQLINYFGLVTIVCCFKYLSIKYPSKINFTYLIFSTPLLIWVVSSQKLILFSSSIFLLIFTILATQKNLTRNQQFFILISLAFCVFIKVSNLVPASIIFFYLFFIFLKNKNIMFIKNCFIVFSIFVFPYFIKNYYLTGDIYYPFFEFFKDKPDSNFIEFYKSLTSQPQYNLTESFINFIMIPLLYGLPINSLRPTVLLGFSVFLIYPLLFHTKKLYKNFEFVFIILIIFYVIFIPNSQPRYFLEAYWVMMILIMKKNLFSNSINFIKYFNFTLKMQTVFLMIMLIIAVTNLLPGSLNKGYYEKIMSKYAYNYNIIEWIYQNVPNNAVIVSSAVRSHSLYKNQFVSREGFFREENLFEKTKIKNISFFVLEINDKNFLNEMSLEKKILKLINRCGNIDNLKFFEYKDEMRNPFNKLRDKHKLAVLIKNKCI
tara:strand:+ start:71 stop:1636 length:1566 start_codon:yes stop_codon:yes gene_type:complete